MGPIVQRHCSVFLCDRHIGSRGLWIDEASPVGESAHAFHGTVGRPLDNVRVRLASDGEILVKGPNVMHGYWQDKQATRDVLEGSGWLATGDIGILERDGFLRITDRKKDLFKDTGGRYIAPQKLEGTMREDPFIDRAVVFGDGRPYCVALITPNMSALQDWCKQQGLRFEHTEEWFTHDTTDVLFRGRLSV